MQDSGQRPRQLTGAYRGMVAEPRPEKRLSELLCAAQGIADVSAEPIVRFRERRLHPRRRRAQADRDHGGVLGHEAPSSSRQALRGVTRRPYAWLA